MYKNRLVPLEVLAQMKKNTAKYFFLQNFNILCIIISSRSSHVAFGFSLCSNIILLDVYPQTNCKPSVKYLLSGHGTSKYCPICFD